MQLKVGCEWHSGLCAAITYISGYNMALCVLKGLLNDMTVYAGIDLVGFWQLLVLVAFIYGAIVTQVNHQHEVYQLHRLKWLLVIYRGSVSQKEKTEPLS